MKILTSLLCFLSIGCGGNTDDPSRVHVSEKMFGEHWPLTVSEGHVIVEDNLRYSFETPAGERYGLNGPGINKYGEIEPIWREQPDNPGWRVNIQPLITVAQDGTVEKVLAKLGK